MNKVILLGNVGKDPEVRHLESGKAVASFSLATSDSYKNKQGEKVTNTDWHNIVAWSPLAEIFEKHVKKGSKLLIEGKIETRTYEDKEGQTKYTTEIKVRNFEFVGGQEGQPKDDSAGSQQQTTTASQPETAKVEHSGVNIEPGSLPF